MIRRLLIVTVLLLLSVSFLSHVPKQSHPSSEGELLLAFIKKECKRHKVPVQLVHNIITSESRWRNAQRGEIVGDAVLVSLAKAYGLMQVQLPTAIDVLDRTDITDDLLMEDNYVNVSAGVGYLAWLRQNYKGNWFFAVAAYNRGILAVDADIEKGISPVNEYASKVLSGVKFPSADLMRMEMETAFLKHRDSLSTPTTF